MATTERVDYDRVVATYDRRYTYGGPAGIAESLRELARTVKARRVLEVGCGTGHWLTLIRDCRTRCGLDYSAEMLDRARQQDGSLGLVRGTATRLPFREETFDCLFCVHALHHFPDPPAFIKEARRVLQSGGALAIVGMDPQSEQDRWYLYEYFPGTRETDLDRYPTGSAILRWLEETRFVRCERRLAARIVHDFTGREVFDDPLLDKDGTSQLSLLPEEVFQDGMARIREAVNLAEENGRTIVFSMDIALPIVVAFRPRENHSGLQA